MKKMKKNENVELAHVTMPEGLYEALCINSKLKNRTLSESVTAFLKLDFRKLDIMREVEDDCILRCLSGLREKYSESTYDFYIDSTVRKKLAKRYTAAGISESEYICRVIVDLTTYTMIANRLL